MPRTRSLGTTMSGRIGRCSGALSQTREKEWGSRLPPAHAFETDPTPAVPPWVLRPPDADRIGPVLRRSPSACSTPPRSRRRTRPPLT